METKQPKKTIPSILGDLALATFAVSIVAVTYIGLQWLTPQSRTTLAQNKTAVLGATSSDQKLTYLPTNEPHAFILSSSLATGTKATATLSVQLSSLEPVSYQFSPLIIRNTYQSFKKIRISPEFSVANAYTSISVQYDSASFEILTQNGTVHPVEIEVPALTSSPLFFTIAPSVRLATPSTVVIDFIEVE